MKQVKRYVWNRENYMQEPKFHQLSGMVTPDASAAPAATDIISLNEVVAGTTKNTRVGLEFVMSSWYLQLQINPGANQYVRLMLVSPRRGYTSLAITDISTSTGFATELLDLTTAKYKIHWDKLIQCDDTDDNKLLRKSKKFRRGGKKLEYTGSAANTGKTPFYLIVFTNQATSNLPEVSYQYKMWFKDGAAA